MTFRFYAELNDHLRGEDREVERNVPGPTPVGALIEGCGIPLEAVDLIVVDGESVGPGREVGPGDRVAVYPVFEAFDVAPAIRLRSRPLRATRFLVASDLAPLAGMLQADGHDVLTAHGSPATLVARATSDGRIVVTSIESIFDVPGATHAVVVAGEDPESQYRQVQARLDLD